MNTTKTIKLEAQEKIQEITVNYSCQYTETTSPERVMVSISHFRPGLELRVTREYQSDGTIVPYPPVSIGTGTGTAETAFIPFAQEFEAAILASVQNIFANYVTL